MMADPAVFGEDVVLREKEVLTDLLGMLPLKAQLGFSGLKDKWSNRGDKGLKLMISAAAKTNDPLVVEYTCLDATHTTISFGSNLGIVYLFDRSSRKISKFSCEQKQVPITSIKLLESRYFVACGQFNGAVTLFNFDEERNGQMKVNLKCTVESHHLSPITCIQWTPDGMKLFTGDSEGNVAITVINMDEGKTHTVFICNEDSPIVQLSFCSTALLISTLRRTLIWPFNTKKIVQVGVQERKVFGNFGACFYPTTMETSDNDDYDIYAARPGLRLWRATIDGKVLTTMMFRESISKGAPEIQTVNLASYTELSIHQNEQKQFGPIKPFYDRFLITFQGSCVWVLDPTTGVVVGSHSNLGCVVDLAVCDNEILILSKGREHFVRKISFEVNPCIVVEDLDLSNPSEVVKAQQSSSINQFEDQDRIDKILDEVGMKMNRALFDVKERVKGITEQIRSRETSEDDRGSESERFSSPKAYYKKDVNGEVCLATSEGYSTGNCASSDENEFSDASFDSSPEESWHISGENCSSDVINDGDTDSMQRHLGFHDKQEPVFGHLSKEEFPEDIVFQGTSMGSTKKHKKKRPKKDCMQIPCVKEDVENSDSTIPSCNEDGIVTSVPVTSSTKTFTEISVENDREVLDGDTVEQNPLSTSISDSGTLGDDSIRHNDNNDLSELSTKVNCNDTFDEKLPTNLNDEIQYGKKTADLDPTCTKTDNPQPIRSVESEDEKKPDEPYNKLDDNLVACESNKSDGVLVKNSSFTRCDPLPHDSKIQSSDTNIVNVKISHQRQGSNVSVASLSERCREIRGEAIEHQFSSSRLNFSISKDHSDTIEGNLQSGGDMISVQLDCAGESDEDEDGKLYPLNPFPPSQKSIYSADSITLSDVSLDLQEELEDEDEKLLEEMMEYDRIDIQNDLIESIDSLTDIEDNDSPTILDISKPEEKANTMSKRKRKRKTRSSLPSSPSSSDLEGRPFVSKENTPFECMRDRLRYLADSWACVTLPSNSKQIQTLACSSQLLWLIDSADQVYFSPVLTRQCYTWKKLDGKSTSISTNPNGSVVWSIDRHHVAHYRVGVNDAVPQGTSWEPFENNVHYIAIDKDSVWIIKKNGDVYVRTGVSKTRPYGTTRITIKANSDLVQITCLNGIVWALDIYNHVQIFQGDIRAISVSDSLDHDMSWSELPGITASHINLGSKGVCWIIDNNHGIWFNQDVSPEDLCGGKWYQLSLGENQSQDTSWYSSVLSYFTNGNESKMIVTNEIAGVMILSKQGSLHAAHGHLLGTRWETTFPSHQNSCWTCISAGGADMNKGYVWVLQPNGQLYCFKSGRQSYNVYPPHRVVLKYCSAGPRSLWAVSSGQDVFVRLGISDTCPQGLKWLKVDMLAQGNRRLMNICAGNHVVWAVDYEGNAWFQMGREDRRGAGYAPAWVPVEGSPLEDGCRFTKVVVGPDDYIVWACDDKNNVYARKDVTENFWIGMSWEIVSGTCVKDLAISNNHVWSLCPNGDVLCRFGVTPTNICGDYWKKVPGNFDKISVSANDELWGIDRHGHLYERQTLLFYGSTLSCKAPSYDDLFSDHNDWEFI